MKFMKYLEVVIFIQMIILISYLLGSFVNHNFNYYEWNESTRESLGVIYVIIAITITIGFIVQSFDNENR